MDRLGVIRADIEPRATEHIQEMLNLTERLIADGKAYAAPSGDVYFRVRSFPGYGKLSGRTPDDLAFRRARRARRRTRKTRWTSPSGKAPSPANPTGKARGARDAPAGTSSARP